MGVFLNLASASPESAWTSIKIYRSTTSTGMFTLIDTVLVTDLTYYDVDGTSTSWYKVAYYDSVAEITSSQSSAIQVRTSYYTNPSLVQNFLQRSTSFSDSTIPDLHTVMEWIFEAEDDIDNTTKHSWRETGVVDEMHTIDHLTQTGGLWSRGRAVTLKHRMIKTLDTTKGDKIEVWDGSTWIDFVANRVEGRANDYWMDYTNGILVINSLFDYSYARGVRATYRYGESNVPKDLQRVATWMVAEAYYLNEDMNASLPGGEASNLKYSEKMEIIKKKIESKLEQYKEISVVTM